MEFFENRKKGTVGLEDGKKRAEYDARKQEHRKQYDRQQQQSPVEQLHNALISDSNTNMNQRATGPVRQRTSGSYKAEDHWNQGRKQPLSDYEEQFYFHPEDHWNTNPPPRQMSGGGKRQNTAPSGNSDETFVGVRDDGTITSDPSYGRYS